MMKEGYIYVASATKTDHDRVRSFIIGLQHRGFYAFAPVLGFYGNVETAPIRARIMGTCFDAVRHSSAFILYHDSPTVGAWQELEIAKSVTDSNGNCIPICIVAPDWVNAGIVNRRLPEDVIGFIEGSTAFDDWLRRIS